jgi:UDP-2-acetamido-2,6-beta-L-arabino-hexul-4-ose reductase
MSDLHKNTIGVTGPRGFIAGHLVRRLTQPTAGSNQIHERVICCSRQDFEQPDALRAFVSQCDTIVHLAGVNRGDESSLYVTNVAIVHRLIEALEATRQKTHVIFASSTQRDRGTDYGRSKKHGEHLLRNWARQNGADLTILVIPNVYGPGCRPFYNSVVATFCHQLAHGLRPVVIDDQRIDFVWINDLVDAMVAAASDRQFGTGSYYKTPSPLGGGPRRGSFPLASANIETTSRELRVAPTSSLTVSELLARLQAIHHSYFEAKVVPDLSNPLDASLYTTFLSHVELDDHCHRPQVHRDARGKLFEILRLAGGGQIFFSTTKPGVVRGNHFHSRKVEWFCVLRGEAAIRLRRVGHDQVREFRVSGESPEFISIPALHTHQIENVGEDELLTIFWCNEIFEPADPDTFYEQVA